MAKRNGKGQRKYNTQDSGPDLLGRRTLRKVIGFAIVSVGAVLLGLGLAIGGAGAAIAGDREQAW